MKPELTVKMKVKDVTIELTLEEVKNLKDALEELTGKIVVQKEYVPYTYPSYPWKWWPYEIYCSSGGTKWESKISDNVSFSASLT
jgi:hypothetical protein